MTFENVTKSFLHSQTSEQITTYEQNTAFNQQYFAFINNILLGKSVNFITENPHMRHPVQVEWLHPSGNPRTTWVEHISPSLGTNRKSPCSFQPSSSPGVVFSESVLLLEIQHADQCQSAQHQAGANLIYTSQHRLSLCLPLASSNIYLVKKNFQDAQKLEGKERAV